MAIRGQDVDFGRGDCLTLPHTPSAALKAGEVVVVGLKPYVTVTAIAANELGNVYDGSGTSTLRCIAGGDLAGGGVKVFWNNTDKKVLAGTGGIGTVMIGWTLPDQGTSADTDEVEIVFNPDGTAGS